MLINRINHIHMDTLYNLIAAGKLSKSYQHNTGNSLNKVLSHVQVTFDITDINIFEAYIMKLFTNSDSLITVANFIDENGIGENNSEKINEMKVFLDSIKKNIQTPDIGMYFFPVGCLSKTISVNLSGTQLFSIFGSLPDVFFKKTFNFSEDSDFTENIPDMKILEDSLVTEFVTNFYKYYQSYVNSIDILVDSFIYTNYFSKITDKMEDVSLTDVYTPYGHIDFTKPMNSQDIQNCVETLVMYDDKYDNQFKNIVMYFTINCNFYTFLEMFLTLPSKFFIDSQDVKTLLSKDITLLLPKNLESYTIRTISKIGELTKLRDEIANSKTEPLRKFSYIMMNSSFKFNMKLSLNDITSTIYKYLNNIDKDKNLLNNNLFNIINKIAINSKQVYRLLDRSKFEPK